MLFPLSLLAGNEVSSSPMCIQGDMFPTVVQSAKGWVWVNEGTATKPKKGYVSNTTGAVLDGLSHGEAAQGANWQALGMVWDVLHLGRQCDSCMCHVRHNCRPADTRLKSQLGRRCC